MGGGGTTTQGWPLAAGAGSDPTRGLFDPASPRPPPACTPAFPQQGPREAQMHAMTTTARSQFSPVALETPHHRHPDPKPSGPTTPRRPFGAAATPRAPPSATAASGPARSQARLCCPAAGPYIRGVPVRIHGAPCYSQRVVFLWFSSCSETRGAQPPPGAGVPHRGHSEHLPTL